jgi:hypothetical protein
VAETAQLPPAGTSSGPAEEGYRQQAEVVLERLGSSVDGLSSAEAARRLDEVGPNERARPDEPSVLPSAFCAAWWADGPGLGAAELHLRDRPAGLDQCSPDGARPVRHDALRCVRAVIEPEADDGLDPEGRRPLAFELDGLNLAPLQHERPPSEWAQLDDLVVDDHPIDEAPVDEFAGHDGATEGAPRQVLGQGTTSGLRSGNRSASRYIPPMGIRP